MVFGTRRIPQRLCSRPGSRYACFRTRRIPRSSCRRYPTSTLRTSSEESHLECDSHVECDYTADADPFALPRRSRRTARTSPPPRFSVCSPGTRPEGVPGTRSGAGLGLPSAGALISRTLALLSHAWKPMSAPRSTTPARPTRASAIRRRSSIRTSWNTPARVSGLCRPHGIESAGLLARLAGDDAGRRACHPRARDRGVPRACLDSRLGQTAAFAARALSVRAAGGGQANGKFSSRVTPTVLEKYPYPETLVARLAEMLSDQTPQGERSFRAPSRVATPASTRTCSLKRWWRWRRSRGISRGGGAS